MVNWREVRSPEDLKEWLFTFRSMNKKQKDVVLKKMVEFLVDQDPEGIKSLAANACLETAVSSLTRGSGRAPRKRRQRIDRVRKA